MFCRLHVASHPDREFSKSMLTFHEDSDGKMDIPLLSISLRAGITALRATLLDLPNVLPYLRNVNAFELRTNTVIPSNLILLTLARATQLREVDLWLNNPDGALAPIREFPDIGSWEVIAHLPLTSKSTCKHT